MVSASAGDVIMANPGEMHDGMPLDGNARRWRMIYIDPALVAREVEEETVGSVEIVHPVARDPLLAGQFARLFACLTAPQSDRLARDERLLCADFEAACGETTFLRRSLALRCESESGVSILRRRCACLWGSWPRCRA